MPNQKILAWLAVAVFIGVISLYVLEFQALGNTIGVSGLVNKSLLVGAIIGTGIGWYLHRQSTEKEAVPIMRRWLVCLLVPLLFMPLLGSLSNRLFGSNENQYIQVEFLEEKAFSSSPFGILEGEKVEPEGFYLFVFINGKMERFKNKNRRYPDAERGDLITLKIKEGAFGYKYLVNN